MNLPSFVCVFMLSISLMPACKKDANRNQPVASLRVINAVIDGGNVKINNNEWDSVLMNNAKSVGLSIANGEASVLAESTIGSSKPFFSNNVQAQSGDVYSLFLFGWPNTVQSLLIKEQIPDWYPDSTMGVRVAHLSPGSGAINITLKIDPTVPILRDVHYKAVSEIVKVSVPAVIPSGSTSFEVRDAWSNELLATYNLPVNPSPLYPGISMALQRFKNITLVVKGSRDTLSGPNAFGVFPAAMSY